MAIITISRGSYSKGKEVAEKVAQKLGYECLSRDILVEASEHFNIPEIKLVRALHDAPSLLERFTYGKERYLSYISAALLQRVQKDNVVYHGLAGHFFLQGVQHLLSVRILADMEDRVRLEMEREGISREDAQYTLKKDDHERRIWSMRLFGKDTWDPQLYDLVIHISKIKVDYAVELICQTVGFEPFKTTPESQKTVDNLALAAKVKAALINACPSVKVIANEGVVRVGTSADVPVAQQLAAELKALAGEIPGVKELKIDISPTGTFFSD